MIKKQFPWLVLQVFTWLALQAFTIKKKNEPIHKIIPNNAGHEQE